MPGKGICKADGGRRSKEEREINIYIYMHLYMYIYKGICKTIQKGNCKMNRYTIVYRTLCVLLGLMAFAVSFFFARLTSVGEFMLFGMVIGLAIACRPNYAKRKGGRRNA